MVKFITFMFFSLILLGDELKIPLSYSVRGLDPHHSYTMNSLEVIDQIYEGLFEYKNVNSKPVLVPLLAEKVPELNLFTDADGSKRIKYSIKLREGVKFQDDPCFKEGKGREVTADDLIFSFKRMSDKQVNSPLFHNFSVISGVKEFRLKIEQQRKQGNFSIKELYDKCGSISGVVKTGKHSIDLIFDRHSISAFKFLALKFISAVPHEAVDFYDGKIRPSFRNHPVGTGPYKIDWDNTTKDSIQLVRNKNWWGKGAKINKINFITVIKPELRQKGILSGELSFNLISKADGDYGDLSKANLEIIRIKEPALRYIFFNYKDKLLGGEKGRKIRQALSLATDINELIEKDTMLPAQSPLPSVIPGFDKKYRNPMLQLNLIKARELLTEAGYKDGINPLTLKPLEVTMLISARGEEDLKRWFPLKRQWKKIGVDLTIDDRQYAEFQERVYAKQFQISYWGWVADYPDPENFYFLLYSKNAPNPNHSLFANKEYDRIFQKLDDPQLRMKEDFDLKKTVNELNKILEKECPWIPIYNDVSRIIKTKKLKGYNINPYNRCYKNLYFEK